MFRFFGLTLGVVTLLISPVFAQETLWVRQYDLGSDEGFNGIASREQTVVGVGAIRDSVNYDYEGLLVKFNQQGETLWTRIFDLGGDEWLTDAAIDSEGNIYLTGRGEVESLFGGFSKKKTVFPSNSSQQTYYVIIAKLDSAGGTEWLHVRPSFQGIGVAVDSAGNCYASGNFYNGFEYDLAVAKFLPDGDTAWVRTFNTAFWETLLRGVIDQNGNLVAGGFQFDFLTYTYNGILTKINPVGETLWLKTFSLDSITWLIGVDVDRDGNLVASGLCGTQKNVDLLVLKTNPSGETLWSRRFDYTEDDEGIGVVCGSEGFIFTTGFFDDGDCRLLKLNPDGGLVWEFCYNHGGLEMFADISLDETGNPICAGATDLGSYPNDLLIAKFSPITGVAEGKRPARENAPVFISQGALILQAPVAGKYQVKVFDLTGKKVGEFLNLGLNPGKNLVPLPALASGVYIIRVTEPSNRVNNYKAMLVK